MPANRARAADDGRVDTLHHAPAADITREIELIRGVIGDGLVWSESGDVLIAGIDRQVVAVDARELTVEVISGEDVARHPLWVGAGEIWYAADRGEQSEIMRVRVRRESEDSASR